MLKKGLSVFVVFALAHCAQSNVVFDPVVNKPPVASTSPTQGTATVSVTFPSGDATHASQTFTVLLYKDGGLVAGVPSATVTTGAGGATVTQTLISPSGTNCLTGSNATLANGNYDLYFAVRSAGDANVTFTNNAIAGCGANGHIQSSDATATFLTAHATMTINGDTTYSITNGNTSVGVKHTFDIQSGPGSTYRCFIVDPNTTTFTSTSHPLAYYTRTGIGTMTGNGAAVNLLPAGTYKYYCYADAAGGASVYFDTGDKLATGTLTVNNGNTTVLTTASFSITL